MEEYDDLVTATKVFPHLKEKYLMFISKSGFTEPVLSVSGGQADKLIRLTRCPWIWILQNPLSAGIFLYRHAFITA